MFTRVRVVGQIPRMTLRRGITRRRYDVAFYVPRIAPLLVRNATTPAGGAETQILLLARGLAERGARVCFIVFDLPSAMMPESVDGVRTLVRPPYRARQRLGKFREALSIGRAIQRADAAVVVTRMESPEVGPVAFFTKLLGRRFIYSSASLSDFVPDAGRAAVSVRSGRRNDPSSLLSDVDFSRLGLKPRDRKLFRLGLRFADEIVVQTEEQVRLCEAHVGRSPVLIRSLAEVVPQPESDPEAFLWIGRIVSSKRPEAFVRLARALPDARFWMVAVPASERAVDLELMGALRKSAATAPNLELLRPRPREELMNLVTRAVAMVSTSDFEGMPNTFLEGWARGVPALALAHDPDGVIQGHGLGAFGEGSQERFASLASRLWNQRDHRDQVAERCRRYILDYHSPQVISARWLDVLSLSTAVSDGVRRGVTPH
jgi:glycosyltransferase involved in cell wall biosynthesis